jgi:excisionase family DNA binding protein
MSEQIGPKSKAEYLRAAEVARILHVSPKTISRWAKEDKLPYTKTLGGHRRFPAQAIRELAAKLSGQSTQEADLSDR